MSQILVVTYRIKDVEAKNRVRVEETDPAKAGPEIKKCLAETFNVDADDVVIVGVGADGPVGK